MYCHGYFQCLGYKFESVTSSAISWPVDIIDVYSQDTLFIIHLPPCFTNMVDAEFSNDLPADGLLDMCTYSYINNYFILCLVHYIGHDLTIEHSNLYDYCMYFKIS